MQLAEASVLVTGAGGTVGSVVVERLLKERARIRALVRSENTPLPPGVERVLSDLRDPASLRRAIEGVQLVVHCAAAVSPDLALCTSVNLEGTHRLLQAMEAGGCRALVHVSTVSVYDYRAGLDFDEESPVWTEPLDAYGFSKAEAERRVLEACGRGLGASILRPTLVLSMHPRSYWGPLALERARATTQPIIPVAEAPYVHVENLAEAIVLAARAPLRGRVYNVVDGVGDSREYLEAVAKSLGRTPAALPPEAPRLHYSGARLRNELGYAPRARWHEFLAALSSSALVLLLALLALGCGQRTPPPGVDAGSDAGPVPTEDAGPPADAGVPDFTAATFCEVFARASCRWAIACGERTAGEEDKCVAQLRHRCPRPLKFDPQAAAVCLIRLESARCGTRAERCDSAWPASVDAGGACLESSECLAGACINDGGSCGACGPQRALGDGCDDGHPCDSSALCADGDGGVLCRPRLPEGANCIGVGNSACASGRCVLKPGVGAVCGSSAPGSPCASNASCAASLYCDPTRKVCRVPAALGEACDSQPQCAAVGAACLGGHCQQVPPFSVPEGSPCTEGAQCAWGLACDVRAAAPRCTRRIPFGAGCELQSLDTWDPRCPYLAMCDPAQRVCAPSASRCGFPGYCAGGPAPGEACAPGAVCRGQAICGDPGDGGSRCLPTEALPGEPCTAGFAAVACADSSCVAGACASWPPAASCGP